MGAMSTPERRQRDRRRGGRRQHDRATEPNRAVPARWADLHRPAKIFLYLSMLLVLVTIYRSAEYMVNTVLGIMLLFLLAAVIATLLSPVVDVVEQVSVLRGRRGAAVAVVYLLIVALVVGMVALLIPSVSAQGAALGDQLPALMSRVQKSIDGLQSQLGRHNMSVHLSLPKNLDSVTSTVVGSAVQIITGTLATIVNLLLITVISIYFLVQGKELIALLRRAMPAQQNLIDFTLVAAGSTLAGYVRGQVIMAALLSVYTAVVLSLIGVHFALVIAVVTFFLELIPLAGAPIAMAVAIVLALLQGPLVFGLTLAATLVGHVVGAYSIGLRVIGKAARIHPLVGLGAMLIGAQLGGILGALFAIPLAGILNVYLGALYRGRQGGDAFALPDTDEAVTIQDLPGIAEEMTLAAEEGTPDEPETVTASGGVIREPRRPSQERTG